MGVIGSGDGVTVEFGREEEAKGKMISLNVTCLLTKVFLVLMLYKRYPF